MGRRRLVAVVMVVVALGWAAGAHAHDYEPVNPPFPDPHYLDPQLLVAPSDDLVDNQTVQVTGRYLGANTTNGTLRQCTADLALCESATVSFTTGSNGEINPLDHPLTPEDPPTIPVPFVVRATFVASTGATVNCVTTACVVYLLRPDPPFADVESAHHIHFLVAGAGRYTALTPARILDTRDGTGGVQGPIAGGTAANVQVAGRGGVPPAGASAVVMNVTVTQPTAAGFLTLFPSGTALPLASNLGFTPGQNVPNLVTVKLGADGKVGTYNSAGSTHVIFDVAGWYSGESGGDAGRYRPLVPARVLDTRDGTGGGMRLGPNQALELQVAGAGGVPAGGAGAAVLNVVATATTATSFVTAYPTGSPQPGVSNLNFDAGDTVANRAMVKLGTGGKVTIYNLAGEADIVVDVGGWYTDASAPAVLGSFVATQPARILDTRDGTGGVAGIRPAATAVEVQVTGRGGVPATGVSAVVLNITATQPEGPGFLTAFPSGGLLPLASDLNFDASETRPNLAVVRVGAGGKVTLYVSTATHVIFDVGGWFS
jgi:hypothetical protein